MAALQFKTEPDLLDSNANHIKQEPVAHHDLYNNMSATSVHSQSDISIQSYTNMSLPERFKLLLQGLFVFHTLNHSSSHNFNAHVLVCVE